MSELENSPMDQEHSGAKFARIGTHCHEFAHTLGIEHSSGSRADVMESGNRNGNWAAPAPLNPIARMLKGWLTPTTISGQQQFDLNYSLTAPQVFRINGNVSGEYFLIENRRFDQNMTIGTTSIADYNNSYFMPIAHSQNSTNVVISKGVLVWRVTYNFPFGNYDDNGLIYASGRYNKSYPDNNATETDAGDPFPGVAGIKVLSPWSDTRDPYGTSTGAPNNIFVPNTQSSTNAGMEILSENSTTFTAKMYQSSPQDASPSKPQNLAVQKVNNFPQLTWSQRQEPDVLTGGSINIYRKVDNGSYILVATVAGNSSSWTDESLWGNGSRIASYKIQAIDSQQKSSVFSEVVSTNFSIFIDKKQPPILSLPNEYHIEQNYPNPFNPTTTISYALPEPSNVSIAVFDRLGREVSILVNQNQGVGFYSATFDASKFSSGVYFYTIKAGSFTASRKMLLLK